MLTALKGLPRDVPLEHLPPDRLADGLRELILDYKTMADCAGVLRDFLDAALDRFREGRPDLALQTLEAAHKLLDDADAQTRTNS